MLASMAPVTALGALTNSEITAKMDELKTKFPADKYWNHSGSSTTYVATSTPCGTNGYTCNSYGGGKQCYGFARYLANLIFGNYPANAEAYSDGYVDKNGWILVKSATVEVEPGDIIQTKNIEHSAIVWKVNSGRIYVAECWGTKGCIIKWGDFAGYSYNRTLEGIASNNTLVGVWKHPGSNYTTPSSGSATVYLESGSLPIPSGGTLTKGKAFSISGNVRSTNCNLVTAAAWIENKSGTKVQSIAEYTFSGSPKALFELGNSKIKTGLLFENLAAGEYRYAVKFTTSTTLKDGKKYAEFYSSYFKVVDSSTPATNLPAPKNLTAAYVSDAQAKISWSAVSGATSYEAQYYKIGEHKFKNDDSFKDPKTATSYVSAGLNTHNCWRFQVRAAGSENWAEVVYVKPGMSHTYGSWVTTVAATHTASGSRYRVCSGCDYKQVETIPATGHSYSSTWKTDATYHWHECSCGAISGTAAHDFGSWVTSTAATHTTNGSRYRTCNVCGYKETQTISATGHSYGTAWKSDATNHWHECSCGAKSSTAAHSYGSWVTSTAATHTTDGSKYHICTVCGYQQTETIPATGHSYGTAWEYDERSHWHECSCGDEIDVGEHSFGKWNITDTGCAHQQGSRSRVCTECGYVETQTFEGLAVAYTGWWNDSTHHWHECSCGEIEDKAAHQYANGICSVCGYVGEGIGDITWALKDGTLTISGTGPMADYDLFVAPWYPNCDDIKTVIIEPGITSIGSWAFYYCSELLSVAIPDSVTAIGDFAFFSCENLASVTIPNSVATIGERAFARCSALVSVEIPGDVTAIGECAFIGCENLTTVTIPGNVMTMGDAVFAKCSNLTGITVAEENQYYSSSDGVLFDKDKTVLIQYPAGNERTSYSIPSSVISIRDLAFSGCSSLVSVTIPDSVINIEEEAFCENYSLEGIIVDKSNPYYSGDADGVLFNKEKTELLKYPAGNKRTRYTIPNSVISIGYSAFSDCGNLTSVNIPDNVTSIGDYAFSGCSALTFAGIPNSVTNIGRWAFSLCGLTSVNIPASVAHIGGYAFFYCNGLTSVAIPNSLTDIEESVFEGCNNLKFVTIPNSVTSIGGYAFGDCINLTDINYAGTEEEWTSVNIGDDALPEGAAIHFVSAPVVSAGDLNGDGAVDVTDMACLYTWLSTGKNEGSLDTKAFQKIADVNGDSIINILDYQALYELIKQHP